MTSGTFGPRGTGLSSTVALPSSLASRLRQRTASGGSILYRTIWEESTTPSGRSISALRGSAWSGGAAPNRNGWNGPYAFVPIPWSPDIWLPLPSGLISLLASAASISDNGSTLSPWPTPTQKDGDSSARHTTEADGMNPGTTLTDAGRLASWSTPRAEDAESAGTRHSRGKSDTLTSQARELAGWATPLQRDWKDGDKMMSRSKPNGEMRERTDQLPYQAMLSGWHTATTPRNHDSDLSAGRVYATKKQRDLAEDAWLTDWEPPEPTPGCFAKTPLLSGWPTPQAHDAKGARPEETRERIRANSNRASGSGPPGLSNLSETAPLAGWGTPTAEEARGTPEQAIKRKEGTGAGMSATAISHHALLTDWPTPMAGSPATEEYSGTASTDSSRKTRALLGEELAGSGVTPIQYWGPARITAEGTLLTGCSAAMGTGGQLRPGHSRWLMRLPAAWEACAPTETASTLKRRRPSAPPSTKS
jgi:hypothetical protein